MPPLKTNKITSLRESLVFYVICLQVRFFQLIYPKMFPSGNQEIINVYNIKRWLGNVIDNTVYVVVYFCANPYVTLLVCNAT